MALTEPMEGRNTFKDNVGRALICTLDRDGRLKYYNRTVEGLLSTDESKLLGASFISLLENGSADEAESVIDDCLNGRSSRGRICIEFGNINFSVSMTPVKEKEEIVGVSLIGFAMGEEHREISLDMMMEILQDHDLLVVVFSRDGKVIQSNSSFQRFMEMDHDTVEGKDISKILQSDEESRARMDQVLSQPELPSFVTLPMTVHGRPMKLTWSLHPFQYNKTDCVLAVADRPTMRSSMATSGKKSLAFLAETSSDLISEKDPDEMLQNELDNLLRAEELDFAVLRFTGFDGRPQLFCSGIDFKQARALYEAQVGDGSQVKRVAQHDGGDLYPSLNQERCEEIKRLGFQALICLPLKYRGNFVGAGLFGRKDPIEGIETKKLILQVFSNQIAMIYFHALLSHHYMRYGTELQTVVEVSRLMSSTLDYKEVLDIILHKANELVPSNICIIYGFDHGGSHLSPLSFLCKENIEPEALGVDLGEGITGWVARNGKGELVERADLDKRAAQIPGTPNEPSSIISVPLRIGDEMLGVMTLEKTPGKPYSEDEYRLMELFSVHAAMALKNSGRFQDIKTKVSAQKIYNILLTHDVANYNVPIHGFLELLIKDPKLDERQRRYVKGALVQSQNISNLIMDVRKLWNILESDSTAELMPVDIVPLLHEIIREIKSSFLYTDIPIEMQYPDGSAVVMADPLVRDVLFNIVNNSAKFGDQKMVEISVRPNIAEGHNYWRVEVRDQGKGITDERKPLLFQRFEKLDTSTAAEGHGLGLSVVKALVDRYQGKVWVEDRVKGDHSKGSVFIILLPKAG